MKTHRLTLTALIAVASLPGLAHAQGKPLTCIIDQLTPAQRQSVGGAMLSGDGQDAAQAVIEGATASCATKFKPAEINAAAQYARDTVIYEASSAQLKTLGAPAGLIDGLWNKVDPAQRKNTAAALKAGDPPAPLIADLQSRLPKDGDTLSLSATALMGLSARASMAMAEAEQ